MKRTEAPFEVGRERLRSSPHRSEIRDAGHEDEIIMFSQLLRCQHDHIDVLLTQISDIRAAHKI